MPRGIPRTGARGPGGGRKPRAGSAASERLTLRLTPEERASLARAAGAETLSTWARRALLAAARYPRG